MTEEGLWDTRKPAYGFGRILILVYGIFAVAALARSIVQLARDASEAPLAYGLSLFAAAVYIVATIALAHNGRRMRRVAWTAVIIEAAGVLVVGTLSIVAPELFPRDTVWSQFGRGYGFVPLVLPWVGMWWLWTSSPVRIARLAEGRPGRRNAARCSVVGVYRAIYDSVLVHTDPEAIHGLAVGAIAVAGRVGVSRRALQATLGRGFAREGVRAAVTSPRLRVFPRPFPGVLGLAAGMDKNATAILGMTALGFGFVEVGTVTARPQPGNERPRLWRHPEIEALRNRMGFNNEGAEVVSRRLRALRSTPEGRAAVVGVNIGKNRATALEDAAADYAASARLLARWADYLVVNVSSPNTPGLRELQDAAALAPILRAVRAEAGRAAGREVPLLVKIAPDLEDAQVAAIADLVRSESLTGVSATNTTIAHGLGPGGLSGAPLRRRALEVVTILRKELGESPVIIAGGGIFTPGHGREFLDAGADLLQAYTAFVYEGPAWPGRLNRALTS